MKDEMKNGKTGTVSTIFGKENLKVTCVERKYKVSNSKIGFIVTAKKELDENTTNELLHEDMELKTFLANYEITDVVPVPACHESANIAEKNVSAIKMPIKNIRHSDIRVKSNDKQTGDHGVSKNANNEAKKRRELFDSLDLPERFVTKDYKEALAKKGIVTTNTAMPYDDLECLAKQGKIARMGKEEHGTVAFIKKKNEAEIVTQ